MIADDTKIWAKIAVREDAGSLREDVNRLYSGQKVTVEV